MSAARAARAAGARAATKTATKTTKARGKGAKAAAAAKPLAFDPAHLALLPRPQPPADALAAIAAAVQLTWPQPGTADEQNPVHFAWRFSGRWWNKPTALRRDRPWARR